MTNTTSAFLLKNQKIMSHHDNAARLSQLHFAIALFFESTRYLHQLMLFWLLPPAQYGQVGALFALAYLAANLATLEGGTALVPHIHAIAAHPLRYSYLTHDFLAPQAMSHLIAASAASAAAYLLTKSPVLAGAVFTTAVGEGLRIAMRPLIYAIARSEYVAAIEARLAAGYILTMWIMAALQKRPPSPDVLLCGYALASLTGACYLVTVGLKTLKAIHTQPAPLPPRTTIQRTQAALLALHLPHTLFSANFLVPFFAYAHGPAAAGIVKITSEVAGILRGIIRSSVAFPLNRLVAGLRHEDEGARDTDLKTLFDAITSATEKAAAFLIVVAIAVGTTFIAPWGERIEILFAGFCLLTIADYLCIPYELLSIHTKTVAPAAIARGAEVLLDVSIIALFKNNPLCVVGGIGAVRFAAWQVLMRLTRPAPLFKPPTR